MSEILIIQAHPELGRSRVTQAMAGAVRAAASERIAVRDLYQRYPDYALDLSAEQAALSQARLVVWLHPLQWYGMPALLKLWVDEVLAFGWAYGPGGHALAGKDLWLLSSTGGSREDYAPQGRHGHAIEAYLLPYTQIARLCGMRYLPPLLLHDAHRLSDMALQQYALGFVQKLLAYPQWCEPIDLESPAISKGKLQAGSETPEGLDPSAMIDLDARPALFSPLPFLPKRSL